MNASSDSAILSVRDLQVSYPVREPQAWPWTPMKTLRAVRGVSFDVHAGETVGIVGESGCGKSSLARALLNLQPASGGRIIWMGQDMLDARPAQWMPLRRDVQMIFQDPLASLDPRMTIEQIIAEPLKTHKPGLTNAEVSQQVRELMPKVGLSTDFANRFPHEFSGGQAQRIGIARALILQPKLLICDEPVSALDVSIQAQIINLLQQLQKTFGLALVFIAHDLAIVKHISHRVLVMYLGRCMEIAGKKTLYAQPQHPYTRALLAAIPRPDPDVPTGALNTLLQGDLPSPLDPPSGCVFRTRCPMAAEPCSQHVPALHPSGADGLVACHLA